MIKELFQKLLQKLLTKPLFIAIALVLVSFSISNDEFVNLSLWPFPEKLSLPVFLVIIISLFIGFIAGNLYSSFHKKSESN